MQSPVADKDRVLVPFFANARLVLIQTLGANFIEILGEISTFSFKKMHSKISSGK